MDVRIAWPPSFANKLRGRRRGRAGQRGADQFLSVEKTQDLLIDSLAVIATPNQRSQMLLYWERLRDFLGLIVNLSDTSSDWFGHLNSEEKKAILATRRLVKDLIKRFRTTIRAAKPRNGKAVVTV